MQNIRTVTWITPGFVTRAIKQLAKYEPEIPIPEIESIEPRWESSYAESFGEALTHDASILLVMTHGAKPTGAGPGVISPTNRAASWAQQHDVEKCVDGKQIKAKGVIDLACNRSDGQNEHTDWLSLGDEVQWFIAATESVSDIASARALQAATRIGNEDPEQILLHLRRTTPKAMWWLRMRNKTKEWHIQN